MLHRDTVQNESFPQIPSILSPTPTMIFPIFGLALERGFDFFTIFLLNDRCEHNI
ncbi:hypothetical protein L218DRAFT_297129 [Marasmius fiardii PR-910]|nr:hypothetical protein L218DRAFT_297129 [Marasmius fiardii PR-910]